MEEEDAAQAAEALCRYKDRPWDYLNSEGVWSTSKSHVGSHSQLYCVFLYHDRVHWEVWDWSSVGRLQEEPQRRHSPTENTQDLHCNVSVLTTFINTTHICHSRNINTLLFLQRGDKICGNPCPICRDPNIVIHHQVCEHLTHTWNKHAPLSDSTWQHCLIRLGISLLLLMFKICVKRERNVGFILKGLSVKTMKTKDIV